MNTQNLKLEIESLKRRKLNQAIKQLKRESFSSRQLIVQIKDNNNIMKEQIATLSNALYNEIARLTMFTHCCLGRLHHIFISVAPYIRMHAENYHEVAQLLTELLRAIQLLKTNSSYESYV